MTLFKCPRYFKISFTLYLQIDIDLMAGVTRDETSGISNIKTVEDFKAQANYFNIFMHGLKIDNLVKFYLANTSEPLQAFNKFVSDGTMICPTYLFAMTFDLMSNRANHVYFYELTYKSKLYSYRTDSDVIHGSELPFVFGQPLLTPEDNNWEDIEFSRQVMKLWTDFVKYG